MQKAVKRGRPIDENKRDQILAIATKLFMEKGFTATSMDQIAKEASMSKLTLYNRFPDKGVLFAEVIASRCRRYVPDELFDVFNTKSPREAIYTIGHAMLTLITNDDAIRLYRMMVADAAHNPSLIQLFYETGPKRLKSLISEKLKQLNESGALRIADADAARDMFISLFKGSELYTNRLLNITQSPTPQEIESHTQRVVDFFMRAYS